MFNCAGMKHVITINPYIITKSMESFPFRIWYSRLEWKDIIEKLLNDAHQNQTEKKSANVKCTLESWFYFNR